MMKLNGYAIFIFLLFFSMLWSQDNLIDRLAKIKEKEQKIVQLDQAIVKAQKQYEEAAGNSNLTDEKNKIITDIERLKSQKRNMEIDILKIKAVIYDAEISRPVWAEGYGEVYCDKNRPFEECRRLVLMYARRDAMEKGGKMMVESFTRLKKIEEIRKDASGTQSDYYETYLNIIQSKALVDIVAQDTSGEFGQVKRDGSGDDLKLSVKIRVKMQSLDGHNPYRLKIREREKENEQDKIN